LFYCQKSTNGEQGRSVQVSNEGVNLLHYFITNLTKFSILLFFFQSSLCNHGLFQIFEYSLTDSDVKVRLAGAEILDPKESSTSLIEVIIDQFTKDSDEGIKMQYAEVMRALLDTNAGIGESVMAEISRVSYW
jgi:hypothetical protein